MKNEKLKKAEVLLDAVGEIDDAFLDEALSYKKRRRTSSRMLIIAATLALSLTLVAGAVVGVRQAGSFLGELVFGAGDNESGKESGEVSDPLNVYLLSIADMSGFTYLQSEAEIPYTSGEAHVVWQYEGDSGYYLSRSLSLAEIESLSFMIGGGSQVGSDSPALECKMWVLLGDGRVVTPYLKANAGNISNRVFDYEAEIMPTQRLADRISAILS